MEYDDDGGGGRRSGIVLWYRLDSPLFPVLTWLSVHAAAVRHQKQLGSRAALDMVVSLSCPSSSDADGR